MEQNQQHDLHDAAIFRQYTEWIAFSFWGEALNNELCYAIMSRVQYNFPKFN